MRLLLRAFPVEAATEVQRIAWLLLLFGSSG